MSLCRLNHRLPWGQAYPDVVQSTAEFHHEIADARLPQADPVFHNPTPLDAAVDVLDPEPPLVERLVGQVLLQGQLRTAGLLRRHQDLDLRERAHSTELRGGACPHSSQASGSEDWAVEKPIWCRDF